MTSRIVDKISTGIPTSDGAGVKLKRVIGGSIADQTIMDPFLLFDEFSSNNPKENSQGFPFHPHRGFEAVAYVVNGIMEHNDLNGNNEILYPGSVSFMRAGKGIVHSEMPRDKIQMFQLWINLPKSHKMIDPFFKKVPTKLVPEIDEEGGGKTRVIAGKYKDKIGPINEITTETLYLDVKLAPGTTFSKEIPEDHCAFVYVFEGSGKFGPNGKDAKEINTSQMGILQILENRDKIDVVASDSNEGVRFLLIAAKPINEPISKYGPFVMNTQEEIEQAFKDYQSGNF